MPRKARIDASGALHHIIARGIERRPVFEDDVDRDSFLSRLETILFEALTECYAWALLPNHFHLLLRTGAEGISTVMQRLLSGYAGSYNKRHRRCGHLFQNRYKSILCQEDAYLLELVRYIHLNPLRAGIVGDYKQLGNYPYCGHGVLLGKYEMSWHNSEYILKFFAKTMKTARSRYREFVRKGIDQGRRTDLIGGGLVRSAGGWSAVKMLRQSGFQQKADERILGDGDFVSTIMKQANERLERRYRLKACGFDFNKIVSRVAGILDMPYDQIVSSSKRSQCVTARSMVCFWAVKEIGMTQVDLAGKFDLSQPAISAAVRNGELIIKRNGYRLIDD